MGALQNLTFSLTELIALLGLGQALMVILHVIFRMNAVREAAPYLAYFMALALGFALQLFYRLDVFYYQVDYLSWFVWSMATPLSVLLVVSILNNGKPIYWVRYFVLLSLPVCAIVAAKLVASYQTCTSGYLCEDAFDIYFSAGVIAQCLSFGFFYGISLSASEFRKQKNYSERYWLIVCLLIVNLILISLSLWALNYDLSLDSLSMGRMILGLVFVYIMSTLMFRVYPSVLKLEGDTESGEVTELDDEELRLRDKVIDLMTLDKLYQEPSYSRSDLARELEVSEARISNIINRAFDMNFSNFINSYRISEAKDLLKDKKLAVNDIAKLAGFNSIASFNRVFKDIEGVTPTQFRKNRLKTS